MKFALIGSNISASRSPQLWRYFSQRFNFPLTYSLIDLSDNANDQQLLDAISTYDAVNITAPFKFRVARLFDVNSSINLVVNHVEAPPTAYSTDGLGVKMTLDYYGIDINNKDLLIIGAGGSAYSTIIALKDHANIFVTNRTQSRAVSLAKDLDVHTAHDHNGDYYGILSFVSTYDNIDLIDHSLIDKAHFTFDANYKLQSTLLKYSRRLAIDGKPMLFFQGLKAFSICTGIQVTPAQANNLYEEYNE